MVANSKQNIEHTCKIMFSFVMTPVSKCESSVYKELIIILINEITDCVI